MLAEYQVAKKWVEEFGGANLQIADLAAGISWTSALLTKHHNVGAVHAVEISKHRLIKLSSHAVGMMDGEPEKLRRYIGSFYDLQFEDQSMDLIVID